MINILVTGSNGQLGRELQFLAQSTDNIHFDFKDRNSLDITQPEQIIEVINQGNYDYCINCAAYTAVDKAETEEQNCVELNVMAPMLLAMMCRDHNIKMIHISSDYVYHNDVIVPLKETDDCNPVGIYAQSKREGEEMVIKASEEHIIIRTSWLYSSYGQNFVKTMLRLGLEKTKLSIINDQIGTPTYARDLAKSLIDIILFIERNPQQNNLGGIYNYSNEGQTNWFEFAKSIFDFSHIDITLHPIPTINYPAPAERPKWSVLDKAKIKETFKIEIPEWKTSLKLMLEIKQ